jgi:cytochrome bd-type quinol oxidase subunit 2
MQIGSNPTDDWVQLITLVVCVIGLIAWLVWGKHRMGYALTPISYLAHRIIFYVALILFPTMSSNTMAIWASALSLHAALVLTVAAFIMVYFGRLRRRQA